MTRRAQLVVVRLLSLAAAAFALLPRPASAWWETTVTTNKWEYDGVEYLRSDGTAYIDTGILVSSDLSVYNEMYSESKTDFNVDSYYDNTQGSTIRFYRYVPWSINAMQLYCGTSMSYAQPPYTVQTWHSILTDIKNKVAKFDGTSYDYSYATTFTGKTNLAIFAHATVTSSGVSFNVSAVNRERVFKIWQNDVLVRDFIPVRVGSVGYMLDLVHRTLYANAGTGAFTYGAVTGTVTYAVITTNHVHHANPPASAYDALSPWNAPERTRLGGDARTLRPSAIIKEN